MPGAVLVVRDTAILSQCGYTRVYILAGGDRQETK